MLGVCGTEDFIGPYLFENEDGATITVNGNTYRIMITNFFFVPTLHGIAIHNVWFYLNGGTCYTSHAAIDLLHQRFDGGLIRSDTAGLFSVSRH